MAEVFSKVVLEGCTEEESRSELSDILWKVHMKASGAASHFKTVTELQYPSPDWSFSPEIGEHQRPLIVTNSNWKPHTGLLQQKSSHEKIFKDANLHNFVRGDNLPVVQAERCIAQISSPCADRKPTTAAVNHLPVFIFCITSLGSSTPPGRTAQRVVHSGSWLYSKASAPPLDRRGLHRQLLTQQLPVFEQQSAWDAGANYC